MTGTWLVYIYTHSLTVQNLVVILCTAMFIAKISAFLASHYVFMCSVRVLHSKINSRCQSWLVFIMDTICVFGEVRTESMYVM
jgi:hypothetical protein